MKNFTKLLVAGAFIVTAVFVAPNVKISIGEPAASAGCDDLLDDNCED